MQLTCLKYFIQAFPVFLKLCHPALKGFRLPCVIILISSCFIISHNPKNMVFLNVTSCSNVYEKYVVSIIRVEEKACSFRMPVNSYQTTRRHIPVAGILHSSRSDNLNFYIFNNSFGGSQFSKTCLASLSRKLMRVLSALCVSSSVTSSTAFTAFVSS
jgi:hypothetical protein